MARSRMPSWSLAAILTVASNVRRVCSIVATSVVCSWRRLAFQSVREGRRRGFGSAGTATVCGRVRHPKRSAQRTAWPRAVSAPAADAGSLVRGLRAGAGQRAQHGLVLGIARVQRAQVAVIIRRPAGRAGGRAGVVVDDRLHDLFVQAGLVGPAAQDVGEVAAGFGEQMVALECAAHKVGMASIDILPHSKEGDSNPGGLRFTGARAAGGRCHPSGTG